MSYNIVAYSSNDVKLRNEIFSGTQSVEKQMDIAAGSIEISESVTREFFNDVMVFFIFGT
jgi:hypothetical protein